MNIRRYVHDVQVQYLLHTYIRIYYVVQMHIKSAMYFHTVIVSSDHTQSGRELIRTYVARITYNCPIQVLLTLGY